MTPDDVRRMLMKLRLGEILGYVIFPLTCTLILSYIRAPEHHATYLFEDFLPGYLVNVTGNLDSDVM